MTEQQNPENHASAISSPLQRGLEGDPNRTENEGLYSKYFRYCGKNYYLHELLLWFDLFQHRYRQYTSFDLAVDTIARFVIRPIIALRTAIIISKALYWLGLGICADISRLVDGIIVEIIKSESIGSYQSHITNPDGVSSGSILPDNTNGFLCNNNESVNSLVGVRFSDSNCLIIPRSFSLTHIYHSSKDGLPFNKKGAIENALFETLVTDKSIQM